jgi:hypothetical protein
MRNLRPSKTRKSRRNLHGGRKGRGLDSPRFKNALTNAAIGGLLFGRNGALLGAAIGGIGNKGFFHGGSKRRY